MKKIQLLLASGTATLLLVCVFVTLSSPRHKVAKLLSTDFPRPMAVHQWKDNHGGFFGDGVLYGELTFEPSVGETLARHLAESDVWHPLPLSENLKVFLFGGEKDGVSYDSTLSDGWGTLTMTEGYYYILDRKHNIGMDTLLLGDNSTNVTVGLYDSQRSVLYVMTYDS